MQSYRTATTLKPHSALAFYNLGVAYGRRFDATGDQEARRYAVAALTRAQTSCKVATEAARCAAIRDRISRLELLKPN